MEPDGNIVKITKQNLFFTKNNHWEKKYPFFFFFVRENAQFLYIQGNPTHGFIFISNS